MKMSWRYRQGKYIVNKGDGVYCSFNIIQLLEMTRIIDDITYGAKLYEEKDNRKQPKKED